MLRSIALLVAVMTLSACGGADDSTSLPQGAKPSKLDPSKFTTEIDNEYWPMKPGYHWVYRELEDGELQRVDVTVTNGTKVLGGVTARVVHDEVTRQAHVIEDTRDWYAQDSDGNLWYLGENTKEYENGKVRSTEGSWAYGVDGAQAGVIVPADPQQGMKYREEYYAGHAEDAAEVLNVDSQVQVPLGRYQDAMLTRNYSSLEPTVEEMKLYARGVGPVMELLVSGGSGRTELLSFDR